MTVRQPTTRRGRKTRADLVAAAIEVFARDGYVNARVTDIADQAGVGHGTFFRYFESKDDVFTAAANEWSRVFLEELRRPTRPAPPRAGGSRSPTNTTWTCTAATLR